MICNNALSSYALGLLENFVYFVNWNPIHDNTPAAASDQKGTGKKTTERKAKKSAKKQIAKKPVVHPAGAPFSDEPLSWLRLKTLFPVIVSEKKLEDVLLQVPQAAKPLPPPTKSVRMSSALTSKANIKTLDANFEKLPPVLRTWIDRVRRAVGAHFKAEGYTKREDPTAADCPENVLQYVCKDKDTRHYVVTGDIHQAATFRNVEKLPEKDSVFRACYLQLHKEFTAQQLNELFQHILATADTKFVLLVSGVFSFACFVMFSYANLSTLFRLYLLS